MLGLAKFGVYCNSSFHIIHNDDDDEDDDGEAYIITDFDLPDLGLD